MVLQRYHCGGGQGLVESPIVSSTVLTISYMHLSRLTAQKQSKRRHTITFGVSPLFVSILMVDQ